jgi:acyl-CoA thioesterase FadM
MIIPFGHCDPAGILYTPRAMDYCLEVIDEFWKIVLGGKGWYEMNLDLDRGTPFVNINIDFVKPITARAPLEVKLKPTHIGNTSLSFEIEALQTGSLRYKAQLTTVIFIKSELAKVRPDDWVIQKLRDSVSIMNTGSLA